MTKQAIHGRPEALKCSFLNSELNLHQCSTHFICVKSFVNMEVAV